MEIYVPGEKKIHLIVLHKIILFFPQLIKQFQSYFLWATEYRYKYMLKIYILKIHILAKFCSMLRSTNKFFCWVGIVISQVSNEVHRGHKFDFIKFWG